MDDVGSDDAEVGSDGDVVDVVGSNASDDINVMNDYSYFFAGFIFFCVIDLFFPTTGMISEIP